MLALASAFLLFAIVLNGVQLWMLFYKTPPPRIPASQSRVESKPEPEEAPPAEETPAAEEGAAESE